ncbi:hypothetical protein L798_13325 [Zootermopsis nevadensis]|uniref:Uncharacterized protein n=1 Tax=Zootermopsis nevadensis TaxID=136037 RepID=A0A067QUE1_ZOONE|nr:hypothetical protein L798_13325 [Zootermopsis nevadensis]
MSAALARESLELVESAGKKHVRPRQAIDAKNLHRKNKQSGIVQKKLRKEVASCGGVQLSVEELRMRLRVHEDRTEGNVRLLQRLGDCSSLDVKTANKIFERSVKSRTEKPSSESKEESTMFTEEDFKKFEEEYFVN